MKRRRLFWIVLAVAVIIVIVGGLTLRQVAARRDAAADARTATVERRSLQVNVTASGSIEPTAEVDLTFDRPGRVQEVLVGIGDAVPAGQALVRLETTELERAVAQAELNLRQAELRLQRLQEPAGETDVRSAQHGVSQAAAALEVAQLNLTSVLSSTLLNESLEDAQERFEDARNRYEARLAEYERGEIDYYFVDLAWQTYQNADRALARIQQQGDVQLESARSEVQRTEQAYQEALDRLNQLLDGADALDLEAAELDVRAAELALEEARRNLALATLLAPFDGIVAAVNVTVGEMAPSGLPAVSVVDPSLFRITVSVDEIDITGMQVGLPVEVVLDALPDLVLPGTVERIGPAATVDGGVVSYPVVVALAPADAPLRSGMSATATIMVEELAGQLLIPNWTVRIDQTTGQPYVYRQIPGGLEQVYVRLGVRYEGYSQVLDGLDEGDVLVEVRESSGFFQGGAGPFGGQ